VTPDPNAVVVMPGAVVAATMVFRRRIRAWAIIFSAIVGAVLSGPLWLSFNIVHAARWVLVADAALCPMAALGVAWLLTHIRPAATVTGSPTGDVSDTEPAGLPNVATSPPSSDPAEPPLPADLVQPGQPER
jgi:hypothetical protein